MSGVNRNNWREYSTEPELAIAEQEQANALAASITAEVLTGSDALVTFIATRAKPEQDAYADARLPRSWAGFPAYVDICRRRDRAEIRAWREWVELQAKEAT